MSILKTVASSVVFFFFIILSFSSVVISCSKTNNIHDTTYTVIKDTIITKDTVYDLKDGLVAYYNFVNGNLNDSSGYSNNIVFSNASLTSDRFGNPNSAFSFSAQSYMRVNNSNSLSPFRITLMAIVKLKGYYTGLAWGNEIFMKGPSDESNGVYGIRVRPVLTDYSMPIDTASEVFIPFYGDNTAGVVYDPASKIVGGTWYTIVYTYDGTEAKIYIDGVLKNSQIKPVSFTPNSNDLYIGKTENSSFPYYFTGDIDEIRIYNKALSPVLIQQFSKLKY